MQCRNRFAVIALLLVVAVTWRLQPAEGAKPDTDKPTIIVAGTVDCPFCLQLKQRLAMEPNLQPLVRQCNVRFIDIDNPVQAAAITRHFGLERLAKPTMVITDAAGKAVKVQYGMPVGQGLQIVLENALTPLGINSDAPAKPEPKPDQQPERKQRPPRKKTNEPKDEAAAEENAALRQARKLLTEGKTAEAVAIVAPYVAAQGKSEAMRNLVRKLVGDGQKAIASAAQKIETPGQAWVGSVGLVKARRVYGGLPTLEPELTAALAALEKVEGGGLLQPAESLDQARALDEAGDKEAAVAAYQEVIAQHAKTPVAAMAEKRVKQLQGS